MCLGVVYVVVHEWYQLLYQPAGTISIWIHMLKLRRQLGLERKCAEVAGGVLPNMNGIQDFHHAKQ